jgi:hypothetical protein
MGTRREAIKRFLSFAGALGLAPLGQQPESGASVHRRRGIQTLRFLNTAQHWHKHLASEYVDLATLATSAALTQMRTNKLANTAGIGEDFINTLRFDVDEIVPGWRLSLQIAADRTEYRARLDDLTALGVGALSTDTTGLISDRFAPLQARGHEPRGGGGIRTVGYMAGSLLQGCGYTPYNCDYSNYWCYAFGWCCACSSDNNCCVGCFTKCCNTDACWPCTNCGCLGCTWNCDPNQNINCTAQLCCG